MTMLHTLNPCLLDKLGLHFFACKRMKLSTLNAASGLQKCELLFGEPNDRTPLRSKVLEKYWHSTLR